MERIQYLGNCNIGPCELISMGTKSGINMFALGVGQEINDNELDQISGSPDRRFHADDFKDLDSRLIGLIQKHACL